MKACVELCNLGFASQAFDCAIRSDNNNLIKLAGDTALRFTDFDTAKRAYNELSLRKLDDSDYNIKDL